jgi:hypothetical protein
MLTKQDLEWCEGKRVKILLRENSFETEVHSVHSVSGTSITFITKLAVNRQEYVEDSVTKIKIIYKDLFTTISLDKIIGVKECVPMTLRKQI